jgi:hypothetical protein
LAGVVGEDFAAVQNDVKAFGSEPVLRKHVVLLLLNSVLPSR